MISNMKYLGCESLLVIPSHEGMVTEDIASTFEEIAHEQHNHKAEGEIEESPHSEKETGTERRMFTLFVLLF